MATNPLTSKAIFNTEKKMDMTLDQIIKMSKTRGVKPQKQRVSNKSHKFVNNGSQDKNLKVRRFIESRSSFRQGALAQRRSNFQGNHFPLATEAAKKAAVAPIRNRAFNQSGQINVNKRVVVGASNVHKNVGNGGGFRVKKPVQQSNVGPNQKHQTMDSLFANMKEERMRLVSRQNDMPRRNRGGQVGVRWAKMGRH